MFTAEQIREALGVNLLNARVAGNTAFLGVTNDSRVVRPGEVFVAIETEVRDGHDFIADAINRGATGVMIQKPVQLPDNVAAFLVPDTRHALGELARYWRQRFDTQAIVITGNTGKTTTKETIAALLSQRFSVLKSPANFNDEVGLAMTLFQLSQEHQVAVLEAGMFGLGEIARLCEIAQPHTSVVLNVGPTHLERLGSMEAIAEAKSEAIQRLPGSGNAVLNLDDPYVAAMQDKTQARVFSFAIERPAEIRATEIKSRGLAGTDFTVNCMGRGLPAHSPLPGRNLIYNALAAMAVAITDGFSLEEAVHALSVASIPARLQAKQSSTGALILDDSYNASPASMLAALDVLADSTGRRIALLGDMLELGSAETEGHKMIGERAAQVADLLFTIGPRGVMISDSARAAGAQSVEHFASHSQALDVLRDTLGPGDVILIKASHGVALHTLVAELTS